MRRKKKKDTIVPEILSRVLYKDSQGGDAKILGLRVGNQSCKKDSHPPQPLQKIPGVAEYFLAPPFFSKNILTCPITIHSPRFSRWHVQNKFPLVAKQFSYKPYWVTDFSSIFVCHCQKYNWHCQAMGKRGKRNASTMKSDVWNQRVAWLHAACFVLVKCDHVLEMSSPLNTWSYTWLKTWLTRLRMLDDRDL